MREELAWAAGLVDGEGHIGPRIKSSPAHSDIAVRITQCDPEVLYRFKAAVAGLGDVFGPYTDPRKNHSPRWEYQAGVHDAPRVVSMLWAFLSGPKRQQAGDAMRARARYLKGHDNTSITISSAPAGSGTEGKD